MPNHPQTPATQTNPTHPHTRSAPIPAALAPFPRTPTSYPSSVATSTPKRRLLLVGWDAADWKVIHPLLDRGEMPNLARLVENGVIGNIATLNPPYSPMLWTSIATGKRPTKHGVHGFSEPAPDGISIRPVSSLSRKVKAVWNILNQKGLTPGVVGWWPSHPAEPISGVMVSDFFSKAGEGPDPAKLVPGSVHPPSWRERLAEIRVTPMELPGEAIRMFAPRYDRVDQDKDKRIHTLAKLIAEAMNVHSAATEVLEHLDWDFAAVYFDAIDHFSHAFMGYHPPRLPWIREEDFEIYSPIIDNAYRFHDAMLGRLLQLAGPETTVLLLSDHGFHPDEHRLASTPAEAAGPAAEHRHFGIFCLSGPGILKDERIYGASLLDITPTVLHLFGLPVGRDMDGKVLVNALEPGGPPVEYIDSWETVEGNAGLLDREAGLDPVAAAESMKQLVALGYIAPPKEDVAVQMAETLTELKYNLARAYDDAGQPNEAIPLYRELLAANPAEHRAVECLFGSLLSLGRFDDADELLNRYEEVAPVSAQTSAEELVRRREAKPDSELDTAQSPDDKREHYERRRLHEQASGYVPMRVLLRLRLETARGRSAEADAAFEKLQAICAELGVRMPAMILAENFAKQGKTDEALDWVTEALDRDPENFAALGLAARLHARKEHWDEVVGHAARSLGLVYFQPGLHYLLGLAQLRRSEYQAAEQTLRVALYQAPGFVDARLTLAELYANQGRFGDAAVHRALATQQVEFREKALTETPVAPAPTARPQFTERQLGPSPDPAADIVVVTGLPRSGTSMMMQAVTAGGVEPLQDGLRPPDEDNPRGYFEFEPATRLRSDRSWIPQARGKVVKLVLPLVPYLPAGETYRIILIQRNLREVAASQSRMLERLDRTKQAAALSTEELERAYLSHEEEVRRWLDARPGVGVLALSYSEVLSDPTTAARRIGDFLGRPFDPAAAAAAVVPSLRRQFA